MKKNELTEFEKNENTKKMKAWADKYPFAAEMLFGNMTFKEKVKYAEDIFL